jgi:hypothetical protein
VTFFTVKFIFPLNFQSAAVLNSLGHFPLPFNFSAAAVYKSVTQIARWRRGRCVTDVGEEEKD